MSLLHQILSWTASLPLWQRDACRRLLQKESGVNEDDHFELYALIKRANGREADDAFLPAPLANEHVPVNSPLRVSYFRVASPAIRLWGGAAAPRGSYPQRHHWCPNNLIK